MALPVRRRDAAPQPVMRWDPVREVETVQEQLAKPEQERSRRINVKRG
jgi:hypothetical protein